MRLFDTLKERGFVAQTNDETRLRDLLDKERVTFYTGYDPTADSLTIGHFITLMAMSWFQKAGHRPIAVLGGGTGMVGDPTDKTEMRRVMPVEEIENNIARFREQMSKFIDFSDGKALMVNNADWLLQLQYLPFLREYGAHFSVNRMLAADCYKTRWEKGLSFFEFNYMIMQAYDFLELNKRHDCALQVGGDDQWSNMLAGTELIRRVRGKDSYVLTIPLLQTSAGVKMGKTVSGAVWLSPQKTPPYNFYQYLRNVSDDDVIKFMKLLTFMPLEEIDQYAPFKGAGLNAAKERLAFESTKIVHGEEAARKAQNAAKALFQGGADEGDIPFATIDLGRGVPLPELMEKAGLSPSKSEARRNIQQGGVSLNGQKIEDTAFIVSKEHFKDGAIMLQKGKKTFVKVIAP